MNRPRAHEWHASSDTARTYAISLAAVHAVERLENRVMFATYLGAAAQAQSTTPMGINLGPQTYYNTDALFFDVRKEMDDWRETGSPYDYLPSNELTSTGYPLENAYTETEMIGYPMGTYTLVYSSTGNATVSAASMGSIVPGSTTTVTANGVTTTTAQVLVQADSADDRLLLYANNIDAGDQISNLHLYMPGYVAGQTPPELNPNVAADLGPFGTVRLMQLLDTNVSTVANWSDRTTPADSSYTNTSGIAYEDAIAIGNELQENLWFNIPVEATPAYMTDLAELIKYGSDGVNPYTGPAGSGGSNPIPVSGPVYPALDSNLKVYVEYGNELWHTGFPADSYNVTAAYNDPNIPGSSLANSNPEWFSAANNGGEFAYAAEQDVYELRQTYTAFSAVYGAALSSQINFVLAADESTSIFSQAAFTYLTDMSAQWGAPSSWISSYAVPTYINLDSSVDVSGLTLNQLFADLDGQITTSFASTVQADVQFADSYGLPLYSYEGGQGLVPDNVNATVKIEAQTDPRMGQFYTELLNEWYSLGGNLLLPYDFADADNSSGDFGLLQTASDAGSPKWTAVIERLVPVGDANLDGVVDWNDFLILKANYGLTGDIFWQQGDFNGDGTVNAADFKLLAQNIDTSNFTQAQLSEFNNFLATTPVPVQLPETNVVGTAGSYDNSGDTIANVFDGDLTTYFDGPSADGNTVGLNLGSQYSVSTIRYAPRIGFETRMIGGIFEASNDPNFATGVVTLYTITAAPSDGYTTVTVSAPGTYQYVRYVAPDNSYGDVAELQFYGEPPSTTGTPSVTPATTNEDEQSSSGLVITAADPSTVSYQISGITNGTLYQSDGVTPITDGEFVTVAQATAGLKFTPATHLYSTGNTTFSFEAQASSTADAGGLGGGIVTASVTVDRIAHSPAITSATTTEGTQSTSGLVITPNALDSSASALAYQITGITNGTLYLSNGTTAVTNGQFITAAQGAAGLDFTPSAGLTSPSSSFGFSIQASLDGTVGGLGGSVVPATITVNPSAIVAATGTPTITAATTKEDTQSTAGLVLTAADPNTQSYEITGITNGTLYLNDGVTQVTNGQYITLAQGTAGLKFTPAQHLYSYGGTTFSFSAEASTTSGATGLGGGTAVAAITVNRVAHTPTITNASTTEGTQSTSGLVITPNALDTSDANLAYQITGITNGTLFLSNGTTAVTNGQFITAAQGAAGLDFTPAAGLISPSSSFGFSIQASIAGTVASLGGSVVPATITVAQIAHTPTVTSATTTENKQSTSGLVITANPLDTSDANLAYQITGITGGTLYLSDGLTQVSNGQFITAAQGSAGLTFTPTTNLSSPSTNFGFSVQASLNGTVAQLGGSIVPVSITVNPIPVGEFGGIATANTSSSYGGSGDTFGNVFDGNTSTFFDAPTANGNYVQLNMGSPQTITEIAYAPRAGFENRMVGGIFEASNDPTFTTGVVTLYTVTANPADGITTQAVSPGATYQYVRYVAPAGSYGNIAEMQVLGLGGTGSAITIGTVGATTTSAQLVPVATTGTSGSYDNDGDTYANVFDGNTNTFFDSPTASGSYVQADLGSAQTIGEIAYAPRPGFEYRMVGGIFEASNDPTFATGVVTLYTVSSTPSDGLNTQAISANGTYRYVRYVSPANSYGNIAEMQIFGPATTGTTGSGTTTPVQLVPVATTGTSGSYDNDGDTYANVFDGNTNTFFDSPTASGSYVQADLGSAQTIGEIAYAPRPGFEYRMVGGIFEASNDPTFATGVVTLYTVSSTPSDGLNTQAISANGTYRYVRYVAPANSYGNIAEMQIFAPATTGTGSGGTSTTSAQLVPTATTGTAGSYDGLSSDNYTAAFDGNTNTYFDAQAANGDYVQANLGAQHTITGISYAPRVGFEYRMVGGVFEASNDPTFSTGVVTLYTVTSTPVDGLNSVSFSVSGTYQYIRYVAPNGSYGNIAEMQVFGY